jgi:hypothetical protein
MKRFSFKAFAGVAFLHIAGSSWLISAATSHMEAFDRGASFPWFTALSWIWMPVPILLNHHLQVGPAHYFYYLAFPWSSQFVADSSCRTLHAGDTVWPNQSMKPTPKEFASRLAPFRNKLTRSLPLTRFSACRSMSLCFPQAPISVFATTPCRGLSCSR